MKLICWNVNGLRAVLQKGFAEFLKAEDPDVICLQEIKAMPEQVDFAVPGYEIFWHSADRKGYSGTMILTRHPTLTTVRGFNPWHEDTEGRILTAEYADFYLVNMYVPNAQPELTRLEYKSKVWVPALRQYLEDLLKRKPVIVCGDLNVARHEIDLARPKANVGSAGFTAEERAGLESLIGLGFVDIFREYHQGPGHYTWWSYRANARQKNVGWRIDYFLVSEALRGRVRSSSILPHVLGSDHCPITLELGAVESQP